MPSNCDTKICMDCITGLGQKHDDKYNIAYKAALIERPDSAFLSLKCEISL